MSVHQVDEFYISIDGLELSDEQLVEKLHVLISDSVHWDYEIDTAEGRIFIDSFESEYEAIDLNRKILETIGWEE